MDIFIDEAEDDDDGGGEQKSSRGAGSRKGAASARGKPATKTLFPADSPAIDESQDGRRSPAPSATRGKSSKKKGGARKQKKGSAAAPAAAAARSKGSKKSKAAAASRQRVPSGSQDADDEASELDGAEADAAAADDADEEDLTATPDVATSLAKIESQLPLVKRGKDQLAKQLQTAQHKIKQMESAMEQGKIERELAAAEAELKEHQQQEKVSAHSHNAVRMSRTSRIWLCDNRARSRKKVWSEEQWV